MSKSDVVFAADPASGSSPIVSTVETEFVSYQLFIYIFTCIFKSAALKENAEAAALYRDMMGDAANHLNAFKVNLKQMSSYLQYH